ncbi:hypothetical protein A1Q2_03852 [Trichosporon asahii var. asahii CBS 8904]|uniref:WD repeat-containing protein JIP5 n=1 Tax=Trichosporon asahii var. asahii (strain CBS 8904) TaxID=1220162 RepID=K1WKF9_TRIAC|nr:hypothetical protein A1Q2_03852 [Trichosporon asahii var. asahii CBS 8904]
MPDIKLRNQPFDLVFHPSEPVVYGSLLTGEVKAWKYDDVTGETTKLWSVRPTKKTARALAVEEDGKAMWMGGKSGVLCGERNVEVEGSMGLISNEEGTRFNCSPRCSRPMGGTHAWSCVQQKGRKVQDVRSDRKGKEDRRAGGRGKRDGDRQWAVGWAAGVGRGAVHLRPFAVPRCCVRSIGVSCDPAFVHALITCVLRTCVRLRRGTKGRGGEQRLRPAPHPHTPLGLGWIQSALWDRVHRVWPGKRPSDWHDPVARGFDTDPADLTGFLVLTFSRMDATMGTVLREHEQAHDSPVNRIICVNESLTASGDDEGVIKFWDPRSPECAREYRQHFDYISGFSYFDDKRQLVTTSGDGFLSVIDIRSKKKEPLHMSDDQEDELLSICQIKGGQRFVVGSGLGTVSVWDRKMGFGDSVDRIVGHPASVDAVVALTDDIIATGSEDGMVRVIQIQPNSFRKLRLAFTSADMHDAPRQKKNKKNPMGDFGRSARNDDNAGFFDDL